MRENLPVGDCKVLIRWGRESFVQEGYNGIVSILPLTVEIFLGENSRYP